MLLALVVIVTLVPVEYRPVTMLPLKVERSLAFALLGAAFSFAYPRHFVLVVALLCIAAFAIEMLQFLIPSRDPRLIDAVVKCVGAVMGSAAAKLIARLYRIG